MGLDATVYCDCYETNRLKEPPPHPDLISVAPNGRLDCNSADLESLLAFDQWLLNHACEHENGVLLHHWIGNIDLVGLLREELEHEALRFHILLERVLFSGTHTGDYLSLEQVSGLQGELSEMNQFVCSDEKNRHYLERFRLQMAELSEAALSVGKPISF